MENELTNGDKVILKALLRKRISELESQNEKADTTRLRSLLRKLGG